MQDAFNDNDRPLRRKLFFDTLLKYHAALLIFLCIEYIKLTAKSVTKIILIISKILEKKIYLVLEGL